MDVRMESIKRNFGRVATPEEKSKCMALKCKDRNAFQLEWDKQRLNAKTTRKSLIHTERHAKDDIKEAWYVPFGILLKNEGGQLDYEGALSAASTIARKAEHRGPPFIMYNSGSERIEYLHIRKGMRDVISKTASMTTEAELEVSEATLDETAKSAAAAGLSGTVPVEAYGRFPTPQQQPQPQQQMQQQQQDMLRTTVKQACSQQHPQTPTAHVPITPVLTPSPAMPPHGMDDAFDWWSEKLPPSPRVVRPPSAAQPGAAALPATATMPPTLPDSMVMVKRERPDDEQTTGPKAGQATLPGQTPAPQGGQIPPDPQKRRPQKRVKGDEETAFDQCKVLGKRLSQIVARANDILAIVSVDKNWEWAAVDKPKLTLALQQTSAVRDVQTRQIDLDNYEHWVSEVKKTEFNLQAHQTSIDESIKVLEAVVIPIVRQQFARNLKVKVTAKAKPSKRRTSTAASAADEL